MEISSRNYKRKLNKNNIFYYNNAFKLKKYVNFMALEYKLIIDGVPLDIVVKADHLPSIGEELDIPGRGLGYKVTRVVHRLNSNINQRGECYSEGKLPFLFIEKR